MIVEMACECGCVSFSPTEVYVSKPISMAESALNQVRKLVKTKNAAIKRLQLEVEELDQLLEDPRQMQVPGTAKPPVGK